MNFLVDIPATICRYYSKFCHLNFRCSEVAQCEYKTRFFFNCTGKLIRLQPNFGRILHILFEMQKNSSYLSLKTEILMTKFTI